MERDEKIDLCFPTTPRFEVIVRVPDERKEEKKEPVYDGVNGPTFIVSLSDEIKKDWVHSKARMCIKKP